MSGCSSGYIPHAPAASPLLKVGGKARFVEWKIKGNPATLFSSSHWIACMKESTAVGNLKNEKSPDLTEENKTTKQNKQHWFFKLGFFIYGPDLFSLNPSFKVISESTQDNEYELEVTLENNSSIQSFLIHSSSLKGKVQSS